MTWPIRRPAIPSSCKGLELAAIERALVEARGNVTAAARTLSVPSVDLRKFVWATPSLVNAVYEQLERMIDEAEGVLREALRSKDARLRRQAAAFLLSHSEAGRRRGWGRRRTMCDEPAKDQTITVRWLEPGDVIGAARSGATTTLP